MLGETWADRRTVLKGIGAATTASIVGFSGTAAAGSSDVDDSFDLSTSGTKEALVVFDSNEQVDRLRHLDLANGYHMFEVLPIGYTELTSDQIRTVADWAEVRFVRKNVELDYHNDDARSTTGADTVQSDLGFTGSEAHTVIIDTGVDGDHPDLVDDIQHNWRYANPLSSTDDTIWTDAGEVDTDDNGHGTHTTGSVTASGEQSNGEYRGLAPDADVTVYSAGLTLLVVKALAAYDHMIAAKRDGDTDVQIVSNSYGSSTANDFNPDTPLNVATWEAYQSDILSLFSAGNSGPDTDTLNDYAKAPHVLGVAATSDDKTVTDFSSRGRSPSNDGETNYDRKKALNNLAEYYAADRTDTEVDAGSHAGTVGLTDSEFHQWDAPGNAGYVEATLSWSPEAEDLDFYLRKGRTDGEVVVSSASLSHPEALSGEIEGGETYFFEVRPFVDVTADYTIDFTAYEGINRNVTPLALYRNGVGAPGNLVMSTLAPEDPLQAYYEDTEEWYGRISGTSMSCPVTAGAATLVVDAYYQAEGEYPAPIDVLNTIEAEAEDVHDDYNPWNIGAGFVDALDAVDRAADGDLATFGEVKLTDY